MKKTKPKQQKPKNILVFNFDTIKLNNPGLLNDQKISAAYSEFLFEVDESFLKLFQP
jgi:hypothetical protein